MGGSFSLRVRRVPPFVFVCSVLFFLCSCGAPSLFVFCFVLLLRLFLLVIRLFYGIPPLLPCIMVEVLAAEWQRGIVLKIPRQAILMLIGGSIQAGKNMEVIIYMYKYVSIG